MPTKKYTDIERILEKETEECSFNVYVSQVSHKAGDTVGNVSKKTLIWHRFYF